MNKLLQTRFIKPTLVFLLLVLGVLVVAKRAVADPAPAFPLPVYLYAPSKGDLSIKYVPSPMERIISNILQCSVAYRFLQSEATIAQNTSKAAGYMAKIVTINQQLRDVYGMPDTQYATQQVTDVVMIYSFRVRKHLTDNNIPDATFTVAAEQFCDKWY